MPRSGVRHGVLLDQVTRKSINPELACAAFPCTSKILWLEILDAVFTRPAPQTSCDRGIGKQGRFATVTRREQIPATVACDEAFNDLYSLIGQGQAVSLASFRFMGWHVPDASLQIEIRALGA